MIRVRLSLALRKSGLAWKSSDWPKRSKISAKLSPRAVEPLARIRERSRRPSEGWVLLTASFNKAKGATDPLTAQLALGPGFR